MAVGAGRRAAGGRPGRLRGQFHRRGAALCRARTSSRPTRTIIRDLKAAGVVVRHETYEHNYPHCWRTDQPLIYKAIPSWYVKVTAFRDRMVELNQGITWVPEHVKRRHLRQLAGERARLEHRPQPLLGLADPGVEVGQSGISRASTVYGSLDEIERDFGVRPKDLHRPYVDDLVRPEPGRSDRQVDDAPGRGRARLLVRVGLDAVLRRSTTRSRTRSGSRATSPATSSSNMSARPAAGSTR